MTRITALYYTIKNSDHLRWTDPVGYILGALIKYVLVPMLFLAVSVVFVLIVTEIFGNGRQDE